MHVMRDASYLFLPLDTRSILYADYCFREKIRGYCGEALRGLSEFSDLMALSVYIYTYGQ